MSLPIAPIRHIYLPRISGGSIQIIVLCPYCKKNHKHGGGTSLSTLSNYLSERLSGCDTDPKPYMIGEENKIAKSYSADYHRDYHRKYYHEKLKNKV